MALTIPKHYSRDVQALAALTANAVITRDPALTDLTAELLPNPPSNSTTLERLGSLAAMTLCATLRDLIAEEEDHGTTAPLWVAVLEAHTLDEWGTREPREQFELWLELSKISRTSIRLGHRGTDLRALMTWLNPSSEADHITRAGVICREVMALASSSPRAGQIVAGYAGVLFWKAWAAHVPTALGHAYGPVPAGTGDEQGQLSREAHSTAVYYLHTVAKMPKAEIARRLGVANRVTVTRWIKDQEEARKI